MFSRKKDAFCEGIFRLISPGVTPVLRRHHLIIASRNLTELPDMRVQWLSAMIRGNEKKYLTLELSSVSNLVEDMCAIVSEFQSAKIGDYTRKTETVRAAYGGANACHQHPRAINQTLTRYGGKPTNLP